MYDTYEGEPEWTAENCNRKSGDTTFKTCGWCKHSTGICRYDCTIEGTCTLMKSYGKERDVKWDTNCKLQYFGQIDIEALIKSKDWEISNLTSQLKYREEEKETLKELLSETKYVPPLPEHRPHDYYNVGDIVWVFLYGKWQSGEVVDGYRHHDGCVSFILEDFPESRPDQKGPWGCGCAVPGILKSKEIQHFKTHFDDYKHYLQASDKSYNGRRIDVEEMMRALFPFAKVYDTGNGYDE